jgi:hypothetical protein
MEVKEAIEFIEDIEGCVLHLSTVEEESEIREKTKQTISLLESLKSLETTIRGYEVAYTKAVLEKDKLRKELEAYKEMWGEAKDRISGRYTNGECFILLERKYLEVGNNVFF